MKAIINNRAKIVPESNGNPKLFTIKISVFPKKAIVYGSNNLNIKSKTATIIILASMKLFTVIFL